MENKMQQANLLDGETMSELSRAIQQANARDQQMEGPNPTQAQAQPEMNQSDMMARMQRIREMEQESRAASGSQEVEMPTNYLKDEQPIVQEQPKAPAPIEHKPHEGVPIMEDDEEDYEQTGLVLNPGEFKEKIEEVIPRPATEIAREKSMENINEYMDDMDEEIQHYKEVEEVMTAEVLEEEELENAEIEVEEMNKLDPKDFNKKYQDAVIVIDKSQMGQAIDFTEEEREKLQLARSITLKEIEVKEIGTVKMKRKNKKQKISTLLESVVNSHTSIVPLTASGFTVKLKGCTVFELISLLENEEDANPVETQKKRWSLIYSKIVETSIGELTYAEFLDRVSYTDYSMLVFGLTCASFPDDDSIKLDCLSCKKLFDHKYSMKSLIRVEMMSDMLRNRFMETVDNSYRLDTSNRYSDQAPVNVTKRLQLPITGVLVDFEFKNAERMINHTIEELNDQDLVKKYRDLTLVTVFIKQMAIPDPEEPGSYYVADTIEDICEAVAGLPGVDRSIIAKQTGEMANATMVRFGFMNVVCPHCGTKTNVVPVDIETVLFQQCQRDMNTAVE